MSCFKIIEVLSANSKSYVLPRIWRLHPNTGNAAHVQEDGCRLQVLDGVDEELFSYQDVVDVMREILSICQPEVKSEYAGTGGQMGIGKYGFVVRVVGVKGWVGDQ